MNLVEATVISNFDIFETGLFEVSSTYFQGVRTVTYTSPYGSLYNGLDGKKGGFFAIPSVGQTVLISQTTGADAYYLITVVHDPDTRSDGNSIPEVANSPGIPSDIYNLSPGIPQRVILSDSKGNSLVLSHGYATDEQNIESNSIQVKTKTQKLNIEDTPAVNRISLENVYGDCIRLAQTQTDNSDMGTRHLLLRTAGIIQALAEQGMDLIVTEGTEIDINNLSTGVNKDGSEKWGNINVVSENKDINLVTKGDSGRVMIRSMGGDALVQVNSTGEVIIKSAKSISIDADEDINIKAGNNLNIQAGSDINILAANTATMTGSSSTVLLTPVAASLDGPAVQLAPVTPVPGAGGAAAAEVQTNDYDQ